MDTWVLAIYSVFCTHFEFTIIVNKCTQSWKTEKEGRKKRAMIWTRPAPELMQTFKSWSYKLIVLRRWNLNWTVIFRGGAFEQWQEWIRLLERGPWSDHGGIIRGHTDTCAASCHVMFCVDSGLQDCKNAITRGQTSEACPILNWVPPRLRMKINLFPSKRIIMTISGKHLLLLRKAVMGRALWCSRFSPCLRCRQPMSQYQSSDSASKPTSC